MTEVKHKRRPVVGIMGRGESASTADEQLARELGELVAREGWFLLTGGRNAGVMRAANEGAKLVPDSLTIGVLPSTSGEVAAGVDIAIFTGMGDARNVVNVLSSDFVVVCGDPGPGTASEAALAIKSGKPLLLLGVPNDARRFFESLSPEVQSVSSARDVIQRIREQSR